MSHCEGYTDNTDIVETNYDKFSAAQIHKNVKESNFQRKVSDGTDSAKGKNMKFFVWWLQCCYVIFYSPFKPVTGKNGGYKLTVNKFQKIFWWLEWTLIWVYHITDIIDHFINYVMINEPSPTLYFKFLWNVFRGIKILCFFWILLTKKNKLEIMLRTICSPSKLEEKVERKSRWGKKLFNARNVYLFIMYVAKATVSVSMFVFYGSYIGDHVPPSKKFERAMVNGKKRFFILNLKSNATLPYTVENIVFGVTQTALQFAFLWNDYLIASFLYGVLPFTFLYKAKELKKLVTGLINNLEDDTNLSRKVNQTLLIEKYDELKSLTEAINSLFSFTIFAWALERTLIMTFIRKAVSTQDVLRLIYYVTETAFAAIALLLVAEGYRIVSLNLSRIIL
ncbi:unnamed protein product [Orchesella dallaii]|uniref:Gustatory receptor n=1 Tax=Orchesella dallaii TaxID=48710 RepID=A0ABP1RGV2_9HEXA